MVRKTADYASGGYHQGIPRSEESKKQIDILADLNHTKGCRIDDAHAEIESCGVELVQVAATGAMEVRKKEAEKPVEIPPELAGLDWETLINQQYTGGLRGKF